MICPVCNGNCVVSDQGAEVVCRCCGGDGSVSNIKPLDQITCPFCEGDNNSNCTICNSTGLVPKTELTLKFKLISKLAKASPDLLVMMSQLFSDAEKAYIARLTTRMIIDGKQFQFEESDKWAIKSFIPLLNGLVNGLDEMSEKS